MRGDGQLVVLNWWGIFEIRELWVVFFSWFWCHLISCFIVDLRVDTCNRVSEVGFGHLTNEV